MKKNLISIVQDILSDMDSEGVNSISDSVEAEQIVVIVESVYYNIISTRDIPEHKELIKVESLSDNEQPTHFTYGENVKRIENLWYQDEEGFYREVCWCDPIEFINMTDRVTEDYVASRDSVAGTTLRIRNDRQPTYYTSFDDNHIVMDSFDSTVDDTLQNYKVRAYGHVTPVFTREDSYVPDLDATMFPYLIAEAKSTAMSLLKGGTDMKVEQAARRQKSYIQNDQDKTRRERKISHYGRR